MAANAAVSRLHAVMGIDTSAFDAGLKKAEAKVAGLDFSKGIKSGLADVRRTLSSTAGATGALGAALGGLGIGGVAAAAAIGAAFVETRKALAFGDDIADTAKRLDISTDKLQSMRFAVHALGGEAQDADAAIEGFTKAFGAAQSGISKKALKPFQALGLDPKDFKSTDEALDAVIRKISELKSSAQQAAIADKLGLTPMIAAIRDGADAIGEAERAAFRLGVVMDAELVAKAGTANDRFEDLSKVIDIQFKSAMVEAAPALIALMELLAGAAKGASRLAKALSEIRAADVLGAIPGVGGAAAGPFGAVLDEKKRRKDKAHALHGQIMATLGPPSRGSAAVASLGGGGGRKGPSAADVAANSNDAISQAQRAELAARMALVGDITQLAVLREKEVADETAQANLRLQRDASEGKITQAAAAQAMTANANAAAARVALIRRDAEAAAMDAYVQVLEDKGRYEAQIAGLNGQMAATAAERAAFEADNLRERQTLERVRLETDTASAVTSGKMLPQERDALIALQLTAQAKERQAAATQASADIADEAYQVEAAAIDDRIAVLQSQQDLAATDSERAQIGLEILDLEHDLQRLKLEAVVAAAKSGSIEQRIAQAQLSLLHTIQGNERAAASRQAIGTQISEAGDIISQFAEAFDSNVASRIQQSFEKVSKAFATGGPIAAAIVGVQEALKGIGDAIGGSTGAFISGFGSGGLLGGIIGLIGHKKAKKKARKKAEADAKAEAERKAAEVAAAKRDLELRILELSGHELEATAERRKDELAAMDASLRPLQEREWALQDEAAAAEKAAGLVARRHELELQFLRESGQDAAALALERADALAAEDASNRDVLRAIFAVIDANAAREASEKALAEATRQWEQAEAAAAGKVDDARAKLREAYDRDAAAFEAAADKFAALADTLHDAAARLAGEGAGPAQGLAQAKAALDALNARVAAGDTGALDQLQGAAEAFSAASLGGAKSASENARNQVLARKALLAGEALARTQVDVAHAGLAALTSLVSVEIETRDATLSVVEGLAGVRTALDELAGVQTAAGLALAELAKDAAARPFDVVAFTAAAAAATSTPAVDVVSPGSTVTPLDSAALQKAIEQVAVNTGAALRLYRRWDGDGLPDVRLVA